MLYSKMFFVIYFACKCSFRSYKSLRLSFDLLRLVLFNSFCMDLAIQISRSIHASKCTVLLCKCILGIHPKFDTILRTQLKNDFSSRCSYHSIWTHFVNFALDTCRHGRANWDGMAFRFRMNCPFVACIRYNLDETHFRGTNFTCCK